MKTNDSQPEVTCDACGKRYRLKPEMFGRRLRCECGTEIVVPVDSPRDAANDSPHRANGEEAPRPLGGLLTEAMSRQTSAVETALEERTDDAQPSKWRNRYVPCAMAVIGVVGCFATLIIASQSSPRLSTGQAIVLALLTLAVAIIFYLPLTVVSVSYIGKLMSYSFGLINDVVIKLAGITLFGAFVADTPFFMLLIIHEFDYRALILGCTIYLLGFALLTWLLFETELYESVACALLFTAPHMLLAFTLAPAISWWIGR